MQTTNLANCLYLSKHSENFFLEYCQEPDFYKGIAQMKKLVKKGEQEQKRQFLQRVFCRWYFNLQFPLRESSHCKQSCWYYKRAKHNPSDIARTKAQNYLYGPILFYGFERCVWIWTRHLCAFVVYRSGVICWQMELDSWGQTVGPKELKGSSADTDPAPARTVHISLAFLGCRLNCWI